SDLFIGRHLPAVPVGDHTGVVLLDHRHAGADFFRDLRERNALVDAQGDEARAQVARACALRRATSLGGLRARAVVARALGLALPHTCSPVAPIVLGPEAAVVGGEDGLFG